jgi:hypothetical protein
MRAAKVAFLLVVLSAANFAQQSSGTTVTPPPTTATISGCLTGLNGAFILTTSQGERFMLKGRQNILFRYNGKQVQVTGTPKSTIKGSSAPKPGDFQFSSIRTLANVCR